MKRKLAILVAVVLMLTAAAMMTSCSQWADQYDLLDKEGATVSVKFDANGGMFAGTSGVTVVDVFNLDNYDEKSNGSKEISLIDPSDDNRGHNAFEVSKTGHSLAGWFVKETVTNDKGEALDEDGNLASESGKDPAFTLTKWNFSSDKLVIDTSLEYTSSEPALTLTAVWVPYTKFEFYEKEGNEFKLLGTYQGVSLDLPEWDLSTGKLDYKNFISIDGKTLDAAYLDEAMKEPMTGRVEGKFDYETGESLTPVIKIYTEWKSGEWYKISNASQLSKNASSKGCYEILEDLDFTKVVWPAAFTNNSFSGTIIGNGHTISGVTTSAYITRGGDVSHGGIFGALAKEASISDLTFSAVTYTVKSAAKASSAMFGLFAGSNNGAKLEGVSIENSKLVITEDFGEDFAASIQNESFKLALLFVQGSMAGIDISGISCEISANKADVPADFTVSADENGQITFIYAS